MKTEIYYSRPPSIFSLFLFILYWPLWWYGNASAWFFSFLKRVVMFLDDRLAISITSRILLSPLYQDFTIVGVVIGPIIRFLKIVVGLVVLTSAATTLTILYLWWLLVPILLVFGLIIGMSVIVWAAALAFVVGSVLYLSEYVLKPKELPFGVANNNLYYLSTRSVNSVLKRTNTVGDLLSGIFRGSDGRRVLLRLGLTQSVLEEIKQIDVGALEIDTRILVRKAYEIVRDREAEYIWCGHLLLAAVSLYEPLFEWLRKRGADIPAVEATVEWIEEEKRYYNPPSILRSSYKIHTRGGVNRSWSSRPTPTLDKYSSDLTLKVQYGSYPQIIAKESVIQEIVRSLSRKSSANVLLVGKPGSGKTTTLFGIAERIIQGGEAKALWDKRLVLMDPSRLLSGATTPGIIHERLSKIIDEILKAGNILLAIEEIHTVLGESEKSELSPVFTALEPHLENTKLKIIATTSLSNYRKYIEPNAAFARHFQMIELPEATEEQTLEILKYNSFDLEKEYKVTATYPALLETIKLSKRLIHERVFPDKAVDLLEATAVAVAASEGKALVTPKDIEAATALLTHVPLGSPSMDESVVLINLEDSLHKRIVNQRQAIKSVADILRRARVGIVSENRPIGSLLFVGPTGVGKTEITKVLAQQYFGSVDAMVRLDMSEYQDTTSIYKLTGAPLGGGETLGYLTESIRRRPFSMILLDELEKAHSTVLDVFLQVLEDGRLTTGTGVTVDFTNTMIIATSNVGARLILSALQEGKSVNDTKPQLTEELNQSFRPEFLNRFDGIVFMEALTQRHVEEIAILMLKDLASRLMEKYDINLSFDQDFVSQLVKLGFTPELGARPLRRVIQDRLESKIATMILSNDVGRGGTIQLDMSFLG